MREQHEWPLRNQHLDQIRSCIAIIPELPPPMIGDFRIKYITHGTDHYPMLLSCFFSITIPIKQLPPMPIREEFALFTRSPEILSALGTDLLGVAIQASPGFANVNFCAAPPGIP